MSTFKYFQQGFNRSSSIRAALTIVGCNVSTLYKLVYSNVISTIQNIRMRRTVFIHNIKMSCYCVYREDFSFDTQKNFTILTYVYFLNNIVIIYTIYVISRYYFITAPSPPTHQLSNVLFTYISVQFTNSYINDTHYNNIEYRHNILLCQFNETYYHGTR